VEQDAKQTIPGASLYKLIHTLIAAAHYQNSRSKLLFADSSKTREHSVPNHLIYLKSLLTPMVAANWKIYLFLLLFSPSSPPLHNASGCNGTLDRQATWLQVKLQRVT
jgi:hypothetical protein